MGLHGLPDWAGRTYEEEPKLGTVGQHGPRKCLVSVEKKLNILGFFLAITHFFDWLQ